MLNRRKQNKQLDPAEQVRQSRYFKGETISIKEDLPLPWVHYNVYSSFLTFSERTDSRRYICSCAEQAVTNCVALNDLWCKIAGNTESFGYNVTLRLSRELGLALEDRNEIHSKRDLCHRCNRAIPWDPGHSYTNSFTGPYGAYIRQNSYHYGIGATHYNGWALLEEFMTPELRGLFDQLRPLTKRVDHLKALTIPGDPNFAPPMGNPLWEELHQLNSLSSKITRQIGNVIENITRAEFGFKKIGDAYVGETQLFKVISALYPNDKILRHHRPSWLDGLELDIYLPGLNLGVEYQGQQHFKPIEAWGGEQALIELKKRDRKKAELCKAVGLQLLTIDYDEPLTLSHISKRIKDLLPM